MSYDSTDEAADLDEQQVLADFKVRFQQAKQHSQHWRKEVKDLYDMKAGHQWTPEDEADLRHKYQGTYPMVTFNLADKYSDAINGMQINNRQEIRFFPRKEGTVGIDEYATGIVKWNRDQCEAEDEESDMFADLFWVGMGWIEHFLDDTEEAEGWIAQERRDALEMYWDPMARKKNLVDRRYNIRIKPMTGEEYEDFFGAEPENLSLENVGNEFQLEEGAPLVIPIPHDYGTSTGGSANSPKPIYVADYQWYENETEYSVTALFPNSSQPMTQVFEEKEWKKIKSVMDKNGIQYQVTEKAAKCYYRCWIAGDGIMKAAGAKDKIIKLAVKGFTYEAITGKRDRNTNTWYGMGRSIRDPQMWVNKFFSSILYTLSTNAKGGLMVEESAAANQKKLEESWADPASISTFADGALSNGRVQPKPAATYPAGMDKLMTFALEALPMTSGLNPEVLGLSQRDQPNSLEENRKKSAIAIVAWAFDAMRRYYKRSGRLMLDMVKEYLGEGQLIKIVGQEGAQYVPLMKQSLSNQYDIVVDESPTSTNMQERMWGILMQMIPMAISANIPIPPEVIDYSPLSEDLKQKWKQKLQPDPQAQQMQQAHQQLQMAAGQAKVAVDQSKAELNKADAQLKQVEAQTGQIAMPTKIALDQAEAVHKAAQAGHLQAGGGN